MKILCICKQGIVRSGALAWLLKTEFKHDAVSVGWEFNEENIRNMLAKWADKIICFDNRSYNTLPFDEVPKARLWDIGEDRWHNPADPELHSILRTMIQEKLK